MIFFTTSKILTYDVGGYFFEWFSWEFRQHKAAESSGLSSVVEPELFDEFARTQKIPVDFWSRQIGGFQ